MTQLTKPNGKPPRRSWIGSEPLRPPWFRAEPSYTGTCDRCGACVLACPRGILRQGRDGTPEIDFERGGCDFCGACALVCNSGAFAAVEGRPPWSYRAEVGSGCLAFQGVMCQLCEQYCEAGAISFNRFAGGFALAKIESAVCTGCGACISACPARAIAMQQGDAG